MRYFKDSEWRKDPSRVSPLLKEALDNVRHAAGVPIVINVAFSTSGHAPSSYHKRGEAVDFSFRGLDFSKQLHAILSQNVLRGIGYYPWWNNPGWHVDLRQGKHLFWLSPVAGKYEYFLGEEDFREACER